ncbi:MAG: YdcF family protein [Pseudomonadota bacterium]
MKRNGIILACLSLMAAHAVAGWFAGLFFFAQGLSPAPMAEPLQKRDAIVTLTGGSNRLDAGFDLLEHGLGKKLFISGVYHKTEVRQLLKRWRAEPQSSLDCCVVLGFEADNTAGNAVETVEWLRKEGFRSFYLVTANYHIRRALLEFNRLAPGLDIAPFPVVPDKFVVNGWWRDPATRSLVLREYMKYVAAYFFHRRRT